MGLGLKRTDAQVYIYLAKKGPQKGKDLSNALKLPKQRLYPCLNCLKHMKLINSTPNRPATFSAVSFEEALDLLMKAKLEEAQHTRQNIEKTLSDWQSIIKENHTNQPDKSLQFPEDLKAALGTTQQHNRRTKPQPK
jgi:sugar-specific transcriptional regulator TrmB